MYNFIKECVDIYNSTINDTLSFTANLKCSVMPSISKVIINDPAVVIYWSDKSKTVSKCMPCDDFDPEVGLAMSISRKYFEVFGNEYPRKAFKNELDNAKKFS